MNDINDTPRLPKISAMDKALKILAAAPVTEFELRRKLFRAGYPEILVDQAVSECRRRNYINDELLASDCADYLTARGNGSRMVRVKLRRRGLDPELVNEVMENVDPEQELEAARYALDTKLRLLSREKDYRKKKEKAFRFMVTRGYTSNIISKLFSEIDWKGSNDGEDI
ncbi:MAG: regulatory protein RecX [Lentisphaeria bacterium]|nr:regulatory protein RecX [Lentisphaeria bacterium]